MSAVNRCRRSGGRRAWALGLLAGLALGCSGDEGPVEVTEGLRLVIRYDSSMNVERFTVAAVTDDGTEAWPSSEHPAPHFLEPPGVREAVLVLDAPELDSATVLVDGLSAPGVVVGSGQAQLQKDEAGRPEARVTLGAAVVCGDGRRAGREECDDGNAALDDGCSDLCMEEPGWTCRGTPSVCGRCGDAMIDPGELCDDGNVIDGDGCSSTCQPDTPDRPHLLEVEVLEPAQTEGPEWVPLEGARLQLPGPEPGERWVVFASGVLGSSSVEERTAEVGLFVEDQLVDAFGHQTFGGADNGAGFVAFHVLDSPEPAAVSLHFMAHAGISTISGVRLVAVRIPQWAQPRSAFSIADEEINGIDVNLLGLDFEVPEDGTYVVLGKTNVTESPGNDTARVWMVTPDGRFPWDDRSASFSSSREARVPFFGARVLDLPAGDHRVELRGTSSGSSDVDGWWDDNFRYRRRVTVSAGMADVPARYAVPITFDHADWVNQGLVRADGDDLRVVVLQGNQQVELARALDLDSGWGAPDTTIWVRLPEGIAAGATLGDLWLYFGADRFEVPPSDPADIFSFFDPFDGNVLAQHWMNETQIAPQGGILTVPSNIGLQGALTDALQGGARLEARLRLQPGDLTPATYLGAAYSDIVGVNNSVHFAVEEGGHKAVANQQVQAFTPDTPDQFHRYAISILPPTVVVFEQDDVEVARINQAFTADQTVIGLFFRNTGRGDLQYDWVRVRPLVEPEPTVAIEPLQGPSGVRPSRFEGRRLFVFRADVFDALFFGSADARVTTTETATTTLLRFETPEADRPREHLVLMSTRVAGQSSETGRKQGLCLADGQALLRTEHVINRDGSDTSGYHHIAGVVDAQTFDAPRQFSTAIRSPDGIQVQGAASTAVVIRF